MSDRFPSTHWSELAALVENDPEGSRMLVSRLYERYWTPLYAYLRRRGNDPERTADLLQGFFAFLLDKRVFSTRRPEGRLRAFLLASLKNYVADEYDKEQALKRRPREPLLPLDLSLGESLYLQLPSRDLSPDRLYEKHWALSMVERAANRVEAWERQAGRGEEFEQLKPHVMGGAVARPYSEIAGDFEMSESALKVRVHRMRKRLGAYLREDIGMTVSGAAEVRSELSYLRELLS